MKKAYQKARLCLHPDKLQQRGATGMQKYVAEKAFTILQVTFSLQSLNQSSIYIISIQENQNESSLIFCVMIIGSMDSLHFPRCLLLITEANLQSSVYWKLKLQGVGVGQDNQLLKCPSLAGRIIAIDLICLQEFYMFFWMIKTYEHIECQV